MYSSDFLTVKKQVSFVDNRIIWKSVEKVLSLTKLVENFIKTSLCLFGINRNANNVKIEFF